MAFTYEISAFKAAKLLNGNQGDGCVVGNLLLQQLHFAVDLGHPLPTHTHTKKKKERERKRKRKRKRRRRKRRRRRSR